MFLLGIIPGLVIFFGAFVLVESPVWLAKRNGVAEAKFHQVMVVFPKYDEVYVVLL